MQEYFTMKDCKSLTSIRFQVDCQVKLRSNNESKAPDLSRAYLFRQNENKEVAIRAKLPEAGLYALDVYAKKWAADGENFPVVASYMIASAVACSDKQPFPKIMKQLAGETTENIK